MEKNEKLHLRFFQTERQKYTYLNEENPTNLQKLLFASSETKVKMHLFIVRLLAFEKYLDCFK